MHRQLKDMESHMHGEQSEWISKYHDQIEKVKYLESLRETIAAEHQFKYDTLHKKYVE